MSDQHNETNTATSERKIFILLFKENDNYRSLPDGKTIFIYKFFPNEIDLASIYTKVERILSEADPEKDLIVFNGPSVLTSIAGSIWFGDERRTTFGVLAFNNKTHRYDIHQEEIPPCQMNPYNAP